MSPIETLRVIHVGADRDILSIAQYPGTQDRVIIPFRVIAADVLRLNTRALVVSHNHPSGDPTPSAADLTVTRQLVAMLSALGVKLHDHLIIGDGRTWSFRDKGFL
jgi:DNA repair protein RadC